MPSQADLSGGDDVVTTQTAACPKCAWEYAQTPSIPPGTSNEDAMRRVQNSKSWVQSQRYRHMKEKHSGSPDPL